MFMQEIYYISVNKQRLDGFWSHDLLPVPAPTTQCGLQAYQGYRNQENGDVFLPFPFRVIVSPLGAGQATAFSLPSSFTESFPGKA